MAETAPVKRVPAKTAPAPEEKPKEVIKEVIKEVVKHVINPAEMTPEEQAKKREPLI